MQQEVNDTLNSTAQVTPSAIDTQRIDEEEKARPKGYVQKIVAPAVKSRTLGTSAQASSGNGPSISLNFVNADLVGVVEAILGERLGENYVIDDAIEGTVTLQTNRPLTRSQLISTLEEVLAINGASLVAGDGVYKVLAGTRRDNIDPIGFDDAVSRGLSIRVTPLLHTSASAISKLLNSFKPANGLLTIDQDRNLIFSVGTPSEQRNIQDVISILDVDYLRNKAFALVPLKEARANQVADELAAITNAGADDGGDALSGPVRYLPITRMNAILMIAQSNAALDDARAWIDRLDQGVGDGQRLFIYPVKNRRAEELAQIIGKVFAVQALVQDAQSGGLAPGSAAQLVEGDGRTNGFGNAQRGQTFGRAAPDRQVQPSASDLQGNGLGVGPDANIRIVADNSTNALIVYSDYAQYKPIKAALERLDVLPVQVLIEATLVEVSLRNDLEFGVRWFFQEGNSRLDFTDVAGAGVNPAGNGFNYVLDTSDARIVLSALRDITDVEFLSAPNMMVLDNQIARLQVGDEVPVQTRSAVSTIDPNAPIVNDIEYRNTGVILSVRPKVTIDGLVVMDITQEVSDVVQTVTSGIVSPTIQQRRFDSTVAVTSGETVILGGLTSRNTSLGRTGVPILSSIPIIGNAFTSRSNLRERTELLVMITPRVVRNPNEAREATNEMREKLAAMFEDRPSQFGQMLNPMRTIGGAPRDIIEPAPMLDIVKPRPKPPINPALLPPDANAGP